MNSTKALCEGDIIKQKRERFRIDIRRQKDSEYFRNRRVELLQLSNPPSEGIYDPRKSEEICSILHATFNQGRYTEVIEGIKYILEFYEGKCQDLDQLIFKHKLIEFLIDCMESSNNDQHQLWLTSTQLLSQITGFSFEGNRDQLSVIFLRNYNCLVTNIVNLIGKEGREVIREQAIVFLGNLCYTIKEFSQRFVGSEKFCQLIRFILREPILINEMVWLLSSMWKQLAQLPETLMENILTFLERTINFEGENSIDTKLGVANLLANILNDYENQNQLAKRIVGFNNFQNLVDLLDVSGCGVQMILSIAKIFGVIQDLRIFAEGVTISFPVWINYIAVYLNKLDKHQRNVLYWSLANVIDDIQCVKIIIEHPVLMEKIIGGAYFEPLDSKKEITYIINNLLSFGNLSDAAVLIQWGILTVIDDFLDYDYLHENIGQTILKLIEFSVEAYNLGDQHDDFVRILVDLKDQLTQLGIDKKIEQSDIINSQHGQKFDYYFLNN